jgi:hypothetical protein
MDAKQIIAALTKAVDADEDDLNVIQGIHDASLCLGAGCLGPDDVTDDDDEKSYERYDKLVRQLRNRLA